MRRYEYCEWYDIVNVIWIQHTDVSYTRNLRDIAGQGPAVCMLLYACISLTHATYACDLMIIVNVMIL